MRHWKGELLRTSQSYSFTALQLCQNALGTRVVNALGNIVGRGIGDLAVVDDDGVALSSGVVGLGPADRLAESDVGVRHEELKAKVIGQLMKLYGCRNSCESSYSSVCRGEGR